MVNQFLVLFSLLSLCAFAAVEFTVSGMSSGGFMAGQMHVAYSGTVIGAGIVAAGPYYCSLGSLVRVQTACTQNPYMIAVEQQIQQVTQYFDSGLIDYPLNLQLDPVYIFSGSHDIEILPGVVEQTVNFYSAFVKSQSQIVTQFSIPDNHAWATLNEGNPCWYLGGIFVNNCGFDLSGNLLTTVLDATLVPRGMQNFSNIFEFPQANFSNIYTAGLSTRGFIYVPTACQSNPKLCDLHVHFHGCSQYYDLIGKQYLKSIGMNEWAETNNLIIMYPQTTASSLNPYGCWDFWGYTNSTFATRYGMQTSGVWNMAQNYLNIVNVVLNNRT